MSFVSRAMILLLFFIVYIVGLIGNGLLIFIVFRQKNLRTVPNLLVVSLALGDFLFVLFCVPFGAVAYSLEYYPFSAFYCRFENFIINLSLGVSVFSLLALSADRYKIIVKPFSSHANDPSIKLKIIVIFIWLLAMLLALPETVYSGLIMESFNETITNTTVHLTYCWSPNESQLLINHTFMITRQLLRLIIYYLMPLIFVSIFYILIAKHLFQTKTVIFSPIVPRISSKIEQQQQQQPINNRRTQSSTSINNSTRVSRPSKILFGNRFMRNSNPQQQQSNEMNSNCVSKPLRSRTLESDDLLPPRDSKSHIDARRSRDLLYGSTLMATNNGVVIHTLHQDFKTRKQLRARHKVAKTVLFLCIVFFLCWLPKQIHDLYWFVGVLVYSARWNHFWQFNKTLSLSLSYIYSCINPFALYFLSSTFRHFYKRYLFFWTNKKCLCCCTRPRSQISTRQRTVELTTSSDFRRRSSTNNATSVCYDLNRIRTLTINRQQHSPLRMHRYMRSETTLTGSASHLNGTPHQTTVMSSC